MTTVAITVAYARTSYVHIPRRDLALSRADGITLYVTVIQSDHPAAPPLELTGGLGGPELRIAVWPDTARCGSWDYGAGPTAPRGALWSSAGTIATTTPGTFAIAIPAGTMAGWPRRCGFAIQLDQDETESDTLATGRLHLIGGITRGDIDTALLTDDYIPVLEDGGVPVDAE